MQAQTLLLTFSLIMAATPARTYQTPTLLSLDTVYSNCVEVDISEIEQLRSDLINLIAIDFTDTIENKSFGLLEEDWIRLKQLERKLPPKSPLKRKLLYLFRLLISALYQAHKSSNHIYSTSTSMSGNDEYSRENYNKSVTKKVSHPTVKIPTKVFEITTSSLSPEEMDNEAEESEHRPSVLPFNTNTVDNGDNNDNIGAGESTDETPLKYNQKTKTKELYTTTLHVEDKNGDGNLDRNDSFFIATEVLAPKNKLDETNIQSRYNVTERRITPEYGSDVTEDFQDLNINYKKEHDDKSVETKGEATTSTGLQGHKEVKFVEEYEDQDSTTSPVTFVPGITVKSFEYINEGNKTTNYESESKNSLPTFPVQSMVNNTPTTPFPGIEEQGNNNYTLKFTNLYSSTGSYDESKRYGFENSTNLHLNMSTTTSNPTDYSLPNADTNNTQTRPTHNTSNTNGSDSRVDKSLHLVTPDTIPPTQKVKNLNDTFKSFTLVFPEYPKQTSPTPEIKKLIIYPNDRRQRLFYPFNKGQNSSFIHKQCTTKKGCAKVQNIEFYNPQNYERYINQNSGNLGGTVEEVRSFSADGEANHKRWDPENLLWWQKIRSLRKKAVEG